MNFVRMGKLKVREKPLPNFSPLSLGKMVFWGKGDAGTLAFDQTTPVSGDGDPVGKWLDQSGNSNHIHQTGKEAWCPVLRKNHEGVFNSEKYLEFDSLSTQVLTGTFKLQNPTTMYWAFRIRNYVENCVLCDGGDHGDGTYAYLCIAEEGLSSQTYILFDGGIGNSFSMIAGTFYAGQFVFDFANPPSGVLLNTVQRTTNDPLNGANVQGFTLGSVRDQSQPTYSDIDVAEVLIYQDLHTIAQRDDVLGYLNNRYACY